MHRLQCVSQNYAWGKIGQDSLVYKLLNDPQQSTDSPYAELWLGTHPSGESKCTDNGCTLSALIGQSPEKELGAEILAKWPSRSELPFLLKALSIAKPLSIQAHPDKALAEVLHKRDPKNYRDANHKPELVVAVRDFEGLCGFRCMTDLSVLLAATPELQSLLPADLCARFHAEARESQAGSCSKVLQEVFTALMTSDEAAVAAAADSLQARLEAASPSPEGSLVEATNALALRVAKFFPRDVGIFCVYLLQHFKLQPGEALFLAANEPHAYLCGDCVECMASSDNVVRSGLTPKFKDVEVLCSMLTYKHGACERLVPVRVDDHCVAYSPPVQDFRLERVEVRRGSKAYALPARAGPSLVMLLAGGATLSAPGAGPAAAAPGACFYLPAGLSLTVQCADGEDSVVLFRACTNLTSAGL